jgi:hypothetical protein
VRQTLDAPFPQAARMPKAVCSVFRRASRFPAHRYTLSCQDLCQTCGKLIRDRILQGDTPQSRECAAARRERD